MPVYEFKVIVSKEKTYRVAADGEEGAQEALRRDLPNVVSVVSVKEHPIKLKGERN